MINLRHNFSPIIVSDHDQDCLKFIVPKYGLQFHSYSNFDSILVTDIENQCPDSAQSHLLVIKFSGVYEVCCGMLRLKIEALIQHNNLGYSLTFDEMCWKMTGFTYLE